MVDLIILYEQPKTKTINRVDTFCTDDSMRNYDYEKDEDEIMALIYIKERKAEEESILIENESSELISKELIEAKTPQAQEKAKKYLRRKIQLLGSIMLKRNYESFENKRKYKKEDFKQQFTASQGIDAKRKQKESSRNYCVNFQVQKLMDQKFNSQLPKFIPPKSTTQMQQLCPGSKDQYLLNNRQFSQDNLLRFKNDLAQERCEADLKPQTTRGPAPFMTDLADQNLQSYQYLNETPSSSVSNKLVESENEGVSPPSVDSDQPNIQNEINPPQPLVQSGYDLEADMMFGWRPENLDIPGAPIPLHYNYGRCAIPVNPYTNSIPEPLYLGARIPTSLQVHKIFANRPESTGCDVTLKSETYPSYKIIIPKKLNYTLKNKEPQRKFIGMDPSINLNYELKFDSLFECGNLDIVTKVRNNEYDLYMRVDTNTTGHHQWFYYSIQYSGKMFKKQKVTFNICNFTKPASLYSYGMQVCMAKRSKNYLWHKGGEDISYSKGRVIRINHSDPAHIRYYYKLTFSVTLEKEEDKIYFAYSYPYSFSKLTHFLQGLNAECRNKDLMKQGLLCRDLSGVQVPLLTITSRLQSDPKQYNLIKMTEFSDENDLISLPLYKKKKFCIVGARVHPGETPASWMMQGFLKCLTGNSLQAEQLRKRVVFKIVPMSNPDGVISGNYRTSMAGCDLNRRYDDPDFRFHPTVFSIKNMAESILNGDSLKGFSAFATPDDIIFVDMHGHSRKKNVFIYGPPVPLHSEKYYKVRVIPKLLADETEMFRYHSCRFLNEKSKQNTARIVLNKELGIYNCFTFEASFHCYYDHDRVNHEFTPAMYEAMGANLVNSLYEYMMVIEEDERCKQAKIVEKQKRQKKAEHQHEMLKQQLQEAFQTQNSHFFKLAQDSQKTKNFLVKKLYRQKLKRSDSKQTQSNTNLGRVNSATFPQNSTKILNPNEPNFDSVTLSTNGEQPGKSKIFRKLLDIFSELKKFELHNDSSDEEPGTSGDEHYQANYKEPKQFDDKGGDNSDEDEDTGELNQNQMQGLQNEILDAIKEFTKSSKISKQDYYGEIAKQADQKRIQEKMKDKQQNQQLVNYQSQTISIGIKRRSFTNITDMCTDSPQAKPIVKPKTKPEVKVEQRLAQTSILKSVIKVPYSKPENVSQCLLHPINLSIDKQEIQSANITNQFLSSQLPKQQQFFFNQITLNDNQAASRSYPATDTQISQAPTPRLVQKFTILDRVGSSGTNSQLKEPQEVRTQLEQPTQALKKYISVNQWPLLGTLPGIQSPQKQNQILKDLMIKDKKIKPLFEPKQSIEILTNKLEIKEIQVQPATTVSSANYMIYQSPFQNVVAKPVTLFAFDEALNPKFAKGKSGKQTQQIVKREKNKIIKIPNEKKIIKLQEIQRVQKVESTPESQQSKPATILFCSSESSISKKNHNDENTSSIDQRNKSKQPVTKYDNQAVRQMMARKVKQINEKVKEPKINMLDQNTLQFLQKQQEIQKQQLSYRNFSQDPSNIFDNRPVRPFYQQPKNLNVQQLQKISSDLSVASYVAQQNKSVQKFGSNSTFEADLKQKQILVQNVPPSVVKSRAIYSQENSRGPTSSLEQQVLHPFGSENVKKFQITNFQEFLTFKQHPKINQNQQLHKTLQYAIQMTEVRRIVNNSQLKSSLNHK